MALDIQGVGKGKIVVQIGQSNQSIQAPAGHSFGSVAFIWWACEIVKVGDNICFFIGDNTMISDGTYFYYIIDESNYLYTETPAL